MLDLKTEIESKTQKFLSDNKLTPKEEEVNNFLAGVTKNVELVFKVNKKDPKDYEMVVSLDKSSKHPIPVLFTFTRKK